MKKKNSPWMPPDWDKADAAALKALERGDASPDQQKRALDFIVTKAARTYDLSYRPESQRDTDFAEGQRNVGLLIVMLLKADLSKLRSSHD